MRTALTFRHDLFCQVADTSHGRHFLKTGVFSALKSVEKAVTHAQGHPPRQGHFKNRLDDRFCTKSELDFGLNRRKIRVIISC